MYGKNRIRQYSSKHSRLQYELFAAHNKQRAVAKSGGFVLKPLPFPLASLPSLNPWFAHTISNRRTRSTGNEALLTLILTSFSIPPLPYSPLRFLLRKVLLFIYLFFHNFLCILYRKDIGLAYSSLNLCGFWRMRSFMRIAASICCVQIIKTRFLSYDGLKVVLFWKLNTRMSSSKLSYCCCNGCVLSGGSD